MSQMTTHCTLCVVVQLSQTFSMLCFVLFLSAQNRTKKEKDLTVLTLTVATKRMGLWRSSRRFDWKLITLTTTQLCSSVPVNSDSVTVRQHAVWKWSSVIQPSLILLFTPVYFPLCQYVVKAYRSRQMSIKQSEQGFKPLLSLCFWPTLFHQY